MNWIARYTDWLHTGWPSGKVEKLPVVQEDGSTNIKGIYVVGDLTGVPLLKFSAHTGAKAVHQILADSTFKKGGEEVLDVVIIGGGVSGYSAAIEAKKAGLNFKLLEASQPLSTISNFPKGKPIFTYPTDMEPEGEIQFTEASNVKEGLLEELQKQIDSHQIQSVKARADRIQKSSGIFTVHLADDEQLLTQRVIIAIGRSGNYRKLGVQGEELDKVMNRLHDPKDYCDLKVLVVGGGDSAMETAIAIAECGGEVTLSYRKPEFTRPKPENIERLTRLSEGSEGGGSLKLEMASKLKSIGQDSVVFLDSQQQEQTIKNDYVFSMIGREAPLDFFRRSGIHIHGEWRFSAWLSAIIIFIFCVLMYHLTKGTSLTTFFDENSIFPYSIDPVEDPKSMWDIIKNQFRYPWNYYTLAYSVIIVVFGLRRIQRRKTPYVKLQTYSLMFFQVFPLFLLPVIILPWMGMKGFFDEGQFLFGFAQEFFPVSIYSGEREYWRAYGFILAWPLFLWNMFMDQPTMGWLIVSIAQTFVIIPLLVYFFGKGAYCGWICSCGALAETLGDTQRHKMPHGKKWSRLNMIGQVVLVLALILFAFRIATWAIPGDWWAKTAYYGLLQDWKIFNYKYIVDLWMAGVLGVAFYFHFSGRVWCRFACPLAALMHIYARFSRFRILPEKKKCISCNVCTSVCHQGIDIMNFANKGRPMADVECVRCSACVQSCPTGVLSFGQINPKTGEIISKDKLLASPVQIAEEKGKK